MSMIRHLGSSLRLGASASAGLRLPVRRLSTETEGGEQPPPPPPPQDPTPVSAEGEHKQQDSTYDPFLQGPGEGLAFARLTNIGKNMMKSDVIRFFDGCNLSTNDVKVEYNRGYLPIAMMLQFSSQSSFDMALRQTIRKGRLYKLDKVDRSRWDITTSYDGKTVLLQGIPPAAFQEDVERFLSGSNFNPSKVQIFQRNAPEPIRLALVQFPTALAAMNAFSFKNRGFCLNNPISMRVLH